MEPLIKSLGTPMMMFPNPLSLRHRKMLHFQQKLPHDQCSHCLPKLAHLGPMIKFSQLLCLKISFAVAVSLPAGPHCIFTQQYYKRRGIIMKVWLWTKELWTLFPPMGLVIKMIVLFYCRNFLPASLWATVALLPSTLKTVLMENLTMKISAALMKTWVGDIIFGNLWNVAFWRKIDTW